MENHTITKKDNIMERNCNVSGADRKRLVKTIGDAFGIRPKYMGTPSFAFQIASYEVTKHGVLIFEKDEQTAKALICRSVPDESKDIAALPYKHARMGIALMIVLRVL